jgi:hypothetical protein
MPSWSGNINNDAPNTVRESVARSEKLIGDNRALHVRRDTDDQKNITVTLYDIDETILLHLERMNLQVKDSGNVIKVPVFYGSPEIWTSAKRDGYLRDKQGKIMLPAITLKRTSSTSDEKLKYFHRYLKSSVMKKYSSKNKYTQLAALGGQNAPVNDVYNIVFPSHMTLSYHFIIWTEYVEQMNSLVQELQYNSKDYWGSKTGFKFRTEIDSFSHTTELQIGEDRIVKSEFDLKVNGYILPETITTLDSQKSTMEKIFTPKKFIVNTEVVSTGYDMKKFNKNNEKWKNPNYVNLDKDDNIPGPGMVVLDGVNDRTSTIGELIVSTLRSVTLGSNPTVIDDTIPNSTPYLKLVPAPLLTTQRGADGQFAFDDGYIYIYAGDAWHRVAVGQFE